MFHATLSSSAGFFNTPNGGVLQWKLGSNTVIQLACMTNQLDKEFRLQNSRAFMLD